MNMKMKSAAGQTRRVLIRVTAGCFFLLAPHRQARPPDVCCQGPPRGSPDCPLTWSSSTRGIKGGCFMDVIQTFARQTSCFLAQSCSNTTNAPYFQGLPVQMSNISRCVKCIQRRATSPAVDGSESSLLASNCTFIISPGEGQTIK